MGENILWVGENFFGCLAEWGSACGILLHLRVEVCCICGCFAPMHVQLAPVWHSLQCAAASPHFSLHIPGHSRLQAGAGRSAGNRRHSDPTVGLALHPMSPNCQARLIGSTCQGG